MRTSRSIIGLVVLAGMVVPARAADPKIKWEFTKDKPFYQEMTTVTNQKMTVMGMEIKQDQTQTFYFSWTPLEKTGDVWKIRQKIEGLKMNIQIGGTPITYDSTKDAATTNPLADFFKALVGAEFTIELDMKTMKVNKVEGRDAFLKKLSSTSQPMDALLKSILSDDALKQMADPTFAVAPEKDVKKGDTWKRTSVLNMGPVGQYDSTYTYTYEGEDEKNKDLAKIKIDTTLKYSPPAAGANSGTLPFQITSADLKSKEATGKAEFDTKKGRLATMELKLVLDGTLNIDISGSKSEVKLTQDQKTTVKTFDENPIAPKTAEKKTEEKKPDATKPDEKKPETKKPDEKKPDEKKPDEKKPEAKKPDEKKTEVKKPEEKKPGENK